MKSNSTVVLTLILLSSMVAISIMSGAWGYAFGRKALKGITQPAISPVFGTTPKGKALRQGTPFMQEKEILEKVKARMNAAMKPARDAVPHAKITSETPAT